MVERASRGAANTASNNTPKGPDRPCFACGGKKPAEKGHDPQGGALQVKYVLTSMFSFKRCSLPSLSAACGPVGFADA